MPRYVCYVLTVLLLLPRVVHAGDDFALVNRLRVQAGLPSLEQDARLARAAAAHAAYLDRHREPGTTTHGLSAHVQQPGLDGFSGASPGDRALAAGYPQREVLENVSMGYPDAAGAIDGLMAAIYHRLTFLDLESDQLGIGIGERSRVFVLGRRDISALCTAPPRMALHRTPLDCAGRTMTRDHYEALCQGLPDEALFRAPHPVSCPNGARLNAAFMDAVCAKPPRSARFRGHGRYYEPCDNGTRVAADWFDALCAGRDAAALYKAGGRYYEICDPPRQVTAEWFEAHCAALPAAALYADSWRFRRPCGDAPDVRVEYLDQLDAARQSRLPEVVLWPAPDAEAVPPAFFVEEPDPLPDLEVSGYPLSIQFNPARVSRVEVSGFRLYRIEGESRLPVEAVRLLDRASDPNRLLSEFEFVLFPLERLDWGARYLVVVDAQWGGRTHRYSWSFTTQGSDKPLLTAVRDQQRFLLKPGVEYLLYLPPRPGRPHTVLSTRAEHRRGDRLTLEPVDPNTLRVQIAARDCGVFRLRFDGGQRVELMPAGCSE